MLPKILRIVFLLLLPIYMYGQNTIALPGVTNYTKLQYSGGLQNWKIKQDQNGIIYIANNEGLLTFDGKFWNLYPLPNKTIVHSIEITKDNKIYVGGQDEVGYYTVGSNGRLKYHSIVDSFPAGRRTFSELWDIVSFENDIFFRSVRGIYRLHNGKVTVTNPNEEWLFMGECNGTLYAQDANLGMMRWKNAKWEIINEQTILEKNDPVTGLITMAPDKILFTTLKSGIYNLVNDTVVASDFQNEKKFINARVYSAVAINDRQIALGTSNEGVIIIDHSGNIIQRISIAEGLQNNNILSMLPDREGNVWLGLDNGIDMISYNSSIKQLNPLQQNGSGYTALIHDNQLYLGTTNGLFTTPIQNLQDLSFSLGNFIPVQNTEGQTWNLSLIKDQVLLGHHEGAFEIRKDVATAVSTNTGFWNFLPYQKDSMVAAGTYAGLEIFSAKSKTIHHLFNIPHFDESSRYLAIDSENNIWVSHPYHGIFKISRAPNGLFIIQKFSDKNGLPSILNNHIFKIRKQVVAATTKGIYIFNSLNNRFEPSVFYKNILGEKSIRYLKESPEGNIWFIHNKELSVIDFTGTKPVIVPIPQLNNKMLSGFEFIYTYNESNVLVSGEKGFFHINYQKYKRSINKLSVQVRTVKIFDGGDSLLFGGYFQGVNEPQVQNDNYPSLPHNWKTIRFEFSANSFSDQNNLEYSFRLTGFDANWSEWDERTEKEYTNLSGGNYSFEVKVRNSTNAESPVAAYHFKMLPPWYLTKLAYFIYLLLIGTGLFILYKWLKRKFRLQRQKHEHEQGKLKYIHDLEQNKTRNELIALKNEKLEADISFKNAELAASAMHLVKKGELLTKIKKDLSQVSKEIRNPEAVSAIKQMVKKVGEDDKLDEEWEHFARHFDNVHSDYISNLKAKHPNLTGNELKLCANLRMNLSSKEIAQLMNISVRGVEIGRYRLRKKLCITSDVNLFDYIMKI